MNDENNIKKVAANLEKLLNYNRQQMANDTIWLVDQETLPDIANDIYYFMKGLLSGEKTNEN